MNISPDQLIQILLWGLGILFSLIGFLCLYLWRAIHSRIDALEARHEKLADKLHDHSETIATLGARKDQCDHT